MDGLMNCLGTPEHLPMALFNNESLNGFPTGNFSLELLNNIDSTDVRFVCFLCEIFFEMKNSFGRHRLMTSISL